MYECTFCGREYADGTGVTIFKRDGSSLHLCSRKCRVNLGMKRNPRKLKWTAKH